MSDNEYEYIIHFFGLQNAHREHVYMSRPTIEVESQKKTSIRQTSNSLKLS